MHQGRGEFMKFGNAQLFSAQSLESFRNVRSVKSAAFDAVAKGFLLWLNAAFTTRRRCWKEMP